MSKIRDQIFAEIKAKAEAELGHPIDAANWRKPFEGCGLGVAILTEGRRCGRVVAVAVDDHGFRR